MTARTCAQGEWAEATRASAEGDGLAEVLTQRIVIIRDGEYVTAEGHVQVDESGRVREAG